MKHRLYIATILLAASLSMSAQPMPPTITANLDKDTVMIGDRFTLTIEVERDIMQHIEFPTFNLSGQGEDGTPSSSLEVIGDFAPDTIKVSGRRDRLRKRYEMAIFDEGRYNLGRGQALYLDKNIVDTLFTEKEAEIIVATFQIDSTSHAIFDLKPQKALDFRFGEVSGYIGIALGALLFATALAMLILWILHKRGKRLSDIFKTPPPPPPHIVAIEALERLHNQKLWQNNKHKLYYSTLSDILRTYLAGAFSVGAMEMTTDEIVEALSNKDIPQRAKMDLISVLRDADLVKFAKATPEAEENELAYNKAYYFVEETKPVEETEEAVEDEPTKNEKR